MNRAPPSWEKVVQKALEEAWMSGYRRAMVDVEGGIYAGDLGEVVRIGLERSAGKPERRTRARVRRNGPRTPPPSPSSERSSG